MSAKTLRPFQELAIDSGVNLFSHAKTLLDAAPNDPTSRAHAINHNGYLLIEAPTGAGKTLMAGHLVERFSHVEEVLWFWFAPFKGVVAQTVGFLREEFHGLRLRELQEDRAVAGSRRGDVFVTTWQTVATRVKDRRNVRKDGELNPSIDELVAGLRGLGLRIGVVVDEAHHGFHGDTQAAQFFREVLRPEYTVLITATPDDADVREFEAAMGIAELHRDRVSRRDAVEAGLIKTGVKCAAYFVEPDKKALVDLEGTALRDAVSAHRMLKKTLADMGMSLTPLLLIQVDSKDDEPDTRTESSVKRMKERLAKMGFTEEQVAVHTAKEPDSGLLALANDERREVLIFKMAVALGFDAPRAFTLVSMRASRDSDFGVQLVGRILRVHRRLQSRAQSGTLPELLRYGYVFLADAETQTGLDLAGQRINQIQTEYAKVSPTTVVVRVGTQPPMVQVTEADGQMGLFQTAPPVSEQVGAVLSETSSGAAPTPPTPASTEFDFGSFFGGSSGEASPSGDEIMPPTGGLPPLLVRGVVGSYRYALRPGVPRRFKTQVVSPNNDVTEDDCANRFIVSTRELFEVMKNRVPVERRTLDVFTHDIQREFNFAADLSVDRAAVLAEKILCKSKVFDSRELRQALLRKMEAVLREEAMEQADAPDRVAHFLNVILAAHPELLQEAQKEALATTAELLEADELPPELVSDAPLPISPRNIYGVTPAELNSWERDFADLLDRDANNLVHWWHRNLPRKPWSVNVLLPDGRGFYPDFIVGVEGRRTEDNALLAEPKFAFERTDEAPKVQAEHRAYGRVLVLHLQGGAQWMVVRYDQLHHKAVLGNEFRVADAAGY